MKAARKSEGAIARSAAAASPIESRAASGSAAQRSHTLPASPSPKNSASATDPAEVTLVFTNCTFTGNESKSTGGAVEIRTSSCAKFDGITATGNKANQNGGVIYVTSNYSRLYLTGNIVISGNTTSQAGTFVYLYNNNYTNPPKIYTTHSSSAPWYSEVKGNRTNVAFDLTTLP
jgi:hypothetical protein